MECSKCEVRCSGLFSPLTGSLLKWANKEKQEKEYRRRETIFKEGAATKHIYCIRSGRVKVFRTGSNGEDHVIRMLGPGDAFGYRPILAGEPYTGAAIALEESTVCLLSRNIFIELLEQSSCFSVLVMKRLAVDLGTFEEQVAGLYQRTVLQRTAHLLLMMMQGCGVKTDEGTEISASMKRLEMAQMVGTTPETFSRTLRELADEDLISLSRSSILVRDDEALQNLID